MTAEPPPGAGPDSPPLCPFCRSPVRVQPETRRTSELRRCPHCEAELRRTINGMWTLEYVHPDWLPQMREGVDDRIRGSFASVLLRTYAWDEWPKWAAGAAAEPPPGDATAPSPPSGAPAEERFVAAYAGAKCVLVGTHHVWHASGRTGTLWVTDGSLGFEAGSYSWRLPLTEIRDVRDVGDVLEIRCGLTDEPLYLGFDGASVAVEPLRRAAARAREKSREAASKSPNAAPP
jgi:hypothetical protein